MNWNWVSTGFFIVGAFCIVIGAYPQAAMFYAGSVWLKIHSIKYD